MRACPAAGNVAHWSSEIEGGRVMAENMPAAHPCCQAEAEVRAWTDTKYRLGFGRGVHLARRPCVAGEVTVGARSGTGGGRSPSL